MKHFVLILILMSAIASADAYATTQPGTSVFLAVTFETDSAALSPAAKAALEPTILRLRYSSAHRFRLVGQTDARGSRNYNQALSLRRANAVKSYLIDRGVHPARIVLRGMGETRAAVNILDTQGLINDRKVEIYVENHRLLQPVSFASQ